MARDACSDPAVVSLERKIAFLSRADAYATPAATVEVIETHMSWVFLTDRRAYKLKKPVILPFLDFGTIEARRHNCEEEVRLNRRLAPAVYLGVVPMSLQSNGALQLGRNGPAVDWLVEMVRLPADRMLDRGLIAGTAGKEDVATLAAVLAQFYAHQPSVRIDPAARRRLFLDEAARTLEALVSLGGTNRIARARRVTGAQRSFIVRRAGLLDRRVVDGRIVEGHGDLRPEHVCLDGRPAIIDCLEFNRALRLLDPVDELAYLALECERLGAGWVRGILFDAYVRASGDQPAPELIGFYASFRAGLRARLAAWHRHEPGKGRTPVQWEARADEYLALAETYAESAGTGSALD
jgi:aminoglycoside phosphotransferase family enzyme